ncbi:MAG: hypothetical protein Q4C96_09085 [Planctomycetia bacterium]|nr:hypothetical protein [Planctomycetia bacterium]
MYYIIFFILFLFSSFYPNCSSVYAFQALEKPKYKIRLEIFCDGKLQPMEAQQWGAALNQREIKLHGVQIRGSRLQEELDVLEIGGEHWSARGMLTPQNTLLMPGGKTFSQNQIGEIYPYLAEIIEMRHAEKEAQKITGGASVPVGKIPFGLTADTYNEMYQELEQPVGFSTKNMRRSVFLQKMVKSLTHQVMVKKDLARQIVADKEDLITEELQNVSRGTALAYVLRYVGLYLVPGLASENRQVLVYRFIPAAEAGEEIFPVGHTLHDQVSTVFPEIYETFRANVHGADLATILAAVEERLQVPFLYDYNSMVRFGIETAEITVKYKPRATSYSQLLNHVLSQGNLQKEIRVDEAGNVFLWITTQKKVNSQND